MTEFHGRIRFFRLAGLSLLLFALTWTVVSIPLWLANRSLLDGVPTLSPEQQRLAMPDRDFWEMFSSRWSVRPGQSPADAGTEAPVNAMGRGVVRLAEDGGIEWEHHIEGNIRLARSFDGSDAVRVVSFSGQPGEATLTALSPEGGLLWERSAQLPADCLARVDASGRLALAGNGGQVAWLDASGASLGSYVAVTDLRLADRLADGRRFAIVGGRLRCWSAMLEPEWDFQPDDAQLIYASGTQGLVVCLDNSGTLHALDSTGSRLWQNGLPSGIQLGGSQYYTESEFRVELLDGTVVLLFNSSDWVAYARDGSQLWRGRGYPYFNSGGAGTATEIFADGPDGRRCFKSGQEVIYCVDSDWQELWSWRGGSSTDIIEVNDDFLLLHENGRSLVALDWQGRQVWRRDFDDKSGNGFLRTVLSAGGLATFRSYDGLLVGMDMDGNERFRVQLDEDEDYDLSADGRYFYVRGTNLAGRSGNWVMTQLRDALHLSLRYHVDCYDADGRRLWRALLPDGMQVDRLRRTADGGLAVIATPAYDWRFGSNYAEWEFIFRQPDA